MENTKEVCLSKMSLLHRAVNKNPEMFLTTQVACYPKQLSTTFVCLYRHRNDPHHKAANNFFHKQVICPVRDQT